MTVKMTWPMYRSRICFANGQYIRFTSKEADLMFCLIVRYPNPVPINDLIEFLYPNADHEPDTAKGVIMVLACRIRRKLGGVIKSRPGYGFVLNKEHHYAHSTDGLPEDGAPVCMDRLVRDVDRDLRDPLRL